MTTNNKINKVIKIIWILTILIVIFFVFIGCSKKNSQINNKLNVTSTTNNSNNYKSQTTKSLTSESSTSITINNNNVNNTNASNIQQPNIVKDIDGNIYHTIKIGNQVWMLENLKVTHYRNGDPIKNITDAKLWSNTTDGAYCDYNNDAKNADIYGHLYNWYAVNDSRNICPIGWHIPTDEEFKTLEEYLGGNNIAGGKLKESGTKHWVSPNIGASNESGFSALPAGCRLVNGNFLNINKDVHFWTSTERNDSGAWTRYLSDDSQESFHHYGNKHYGFCIRCIKDQS